MTPSVRDWLPWEAAVRPPVKDAVRGAVQSWSAAWFARRAVRVAEVSATAGARWRADASETWRILGTAVAVKCSKAASSRLLSSSLDLTSDQLIATEADRRVVNDFETRLLTDLCIRLEASLGIDGPPKSEPLEAIDPYEGLGGAEVTLADSQGLLAMVIAIPLSSVARLCKSSLPPARARNEPLVMLMDAAGALPVRLNATLGHVAITVSELEALSCGDVVALPLTLEGLAELRLDDGETVVGHGRLAEAADHRALLLESCSS